MGGTFEFLHKGHRKLLKKAFEKGERVTIGITSDKFAEKEREREIEPLKERKKNVEKFLQKIDAENFEIKVIENSFGDTLEKNYDAIVVSPETIEVAKKINKKRKEKGLNPLQIFKVDFELAKDGEPISSTRISLGEIDEEGNIK